MSSEEPFCGTTLLKVQHYYMENLKGSIDIPICIIGSILNIFNILVFTRRNMVSPVNLIFTHLSFAHFLELLAYVVYIRVSMAYHGEHTIFETWTYSRALLLMRSAQLTSIFSRVSVYLVMMLAIWKYIAVVYPLKESQWCNMKTTRNSVVTGYILCILLYMPAYLSHYIDSEDLDQTRKIYIYAAETNSIMYSTSQIIKVVLYELLPSVVIPILGFRLIVILWTKKEHPTHSSNVENDRDNREMKQQINRSIILSVIIMAQLLSFVIPIGLLDLVHAVLVRDYYSLHTGCVISFKVILNILDCVNKSSTFIVYYAVDQDFKVGLKSLFSKNDIFLGRQKYSVLNSTRRTDENLEND